MTQIVSGLFGSMGFRTGALHINDLIDSKHLSSMVSKEMAFHYEYTTIGALCKR